MLQSVIRPDFLEQFQPADRRHVPVGYDQPKRPRIQLFQGFGSIFSFFDLLDPDLTQNFANDSSDGGGIVHQKNADVVGGHGNR